MTLATREAPDMALMEKVVVGGDLASLSPGERLDYYRNVCESLGLNPLTRPFQYIKLNGMLRLYATKDCTEQLARIHKVSFHLSDGQIIDDIYIIKAEVQQEFRVASATGAVSIAGLSGEAKANAFMKAETKACRRATLRLIGLGWLDESETDSIPNAQRVDVNADTGEIVEGQRPALPSGFNFTIVDVKRWMDEQGITPDELVAVTVPKPTRGNLMAWARAIEVDSYDLMRAAIFEAVLELRERADAGYLDPEPPAPEFLDGIPPMEEPPQGALATDEAPVFPSDAYVGLPRKQMD